MSNLRELYALVAQLDRVFGYEPKGRGFESRRAYQKKDQVERLGLFSTKSAFVGINPLTWMKSLRDEVCLTAGERGGFNFI